MKRPSPTLPTASTALLLLVLLAMSIMLVSGRDIAHQLTLAACTDAGDCGTFPDSPPVCHYAGRDRVVARESFAFAQQTPVEGARLIQFGDDSAEVIVPGDDDSAEVYGFLRWEDAQRWVMDHSSQFRGIAGAAAGPTGQPIRDGYLRMLRLTGLDHEAELEPVATTVQVNEPSGPGSHGVLRQNAQGEIVQVTVVMPLDEATAELQDFAAALGIWGFISYTIDLGLELKPDRLIFGGPASEGWSLTQLRSAAGIPRSSASDELPGYAESGEAVLRSFVLDLTQRANTALYREIFAMESVSGTAAPLLTAEDWTSSGERSELYSQVIERVRSGAVAVETTHTLQDADSGEETVLAAVEGLVVQAGNTASPETRLVSARTADLLISSASFDPLLTCEPKPDENEDDHVRKGLL
ncbi:hypothetical protein [Nesterenkonia sp.]|uniref:hypothetical protein n=1 Tax=Nesterenkonia sp. TaxID=704201 RepID=UPI0026092846|nr:hypothetical protein [Nesterenkonia sp.]